MKEYQHYFIPFQLPAIISRVISSNWLTFSLIAIVVISIQFLEINSLNNYLITISYSYSPIFYKIIMLSLTKLENACLLTFVLRCFYFSCWNICEETFIWKIVWSHQWDMRHEIILLCASISSYKRILNHVSYLFDLSTLRIRRSRKSRTIEIKYFDYCNKTRWAYSFRILEKELYQ